jgi:hypothetical protein
MKNKKSIYILLPIVLLIWGGVMYQFFSFSDTNEIETIAANELILKPLKIIKRDTFSIDVNYRDPFLGKIYTPKKQVLTPKIKKKPTIEEPLIWPTIIYKGIVSDTKDKTTIFMVLIAGQTFLMKKGEVQNEVFLKEGDKESIYLKYKGNLNLYMLAE